jgi:hypothetical protein
MSSAPRLSRLIPQLLPDAGRCARQAALDLLVALLAGFTTQLAQLARQADRSHSAKVNRTFLSRWLSRPHWEPTSIYAALSRSARRALGHRKHVPLLIDFTYLGNRWAVLQVSFPFQRRALPLYRAVFHRTDPERGQTQAVYQALTFLKEHLPGSRSRYVLAMDRGFPSHALIRTVREGGWRFVLRVNSQWKMTHNEATGRLGEVAATLGERGKGWRRFPEAVLGRQGKGRTEWSQAHVVIYRGAGYQEAWCLVTSEVRAAEAVRLYRERMKIECEFRDLKGPWGLDRLARWEDRSEVARFLAMVAIYEWHLAHLWMRHRLWEWGERLRVYGMLSWIRITREWLHQKLRPPAFKQLLASF